jgi:integrase
MGIQIRERKLTNGDKSLFLDIYFNGRRSYKFLQLRLTGVTQYDKETWAVAERKKAEENLRLQSGNYEYIPSFMRNENFVNYFRKLVDSKYKNSGTWLASFKRLKCYSKSNIKISAIDEEWLKGFKKFLLSQNINVKDDNEKQLKPLSETSARIYYDRIKIALNHAVKEKLINRNPCHNVKNIRKKEIERVFLNKNEIQILANTKCTYLQVKKAFLFSCYTGLRYSDIVKLKWKDIGNDRINFNQKKTGGFEYLPLSKTAKKILFNFEQNNILRKPDEFIFNLPSLATIEKTLKQWSKVAKINKSITFHVSRHTFATLALTEGIDLFTVSKLLGHKNIKTTQIYAQIIDEKKQHAVDSLPEIQLNF